MRISSHLTNISQYIKTLRNQPVHPESDSELGSVLGCPVFVINLERSRVRRKYMERYLASLGIVAQIFPAVDGASLRTADLSAGGLYDDTYAHQKFSRSLGMGEIGCTLSHIGIYRRMVEERIPMAMVLEDDIMFVPGVRAELAGALAELPSDCDVLQLYYWCKETERVSEHLVRFPATRCMPVGSLAYIIRLSGADKMITAALPVCYPADSLLGRSPRWGVVLYGSRIPLINLNINDVFPSDVHRPRALAARLRSQLKRVIVRAAGSLFSRT